MQRKGGASTDGSPSQLLLHHLSCQTNNPCPPPPLQPRLLAPATETYGVFNMEWRVRILEAEKTPLDSLDKRPMDPRRCTQP